MTSILFPLLLSGLALNADPLAPARQGQIRCSIPDCEHKTCRTFGRYTIKANDTYDVEVRGLTTNDGLVVEYRASGTIEQGAICLIISRETIAEAQFVKSGIVLMGAALARARQGTAEFLGPLLGKKLCSRDRQDGAGIVAEVSVDGMRIPQLDKPTQWVGAGDGYVIAPPEGDVI